MRSHCWWLVLRWSKTGTDRERARGWREQIGGHGDVATRSQGDALARTLLISFNDLDFNVIKPKAMCFWCMNGSDSAGMQSCLCVRIAFDGEAFEKPLVNINLQIRQKSKRPPPPPPRYYERQGDNCSVPPGMGAKHLEIVNSRIKIINIKFKTDSAQETGTA